MSKVLIEVTQEDIKKGSIESCGWCPIALALRRMGYHLPWVNTDTIEIGLEPNRVALPTPKNAVAFIEAFDCDELTETPIAPFSFTLNVPARVKPLRAPSPVTQQQAGEGA